MFGFVKLVCQVALNLYYALINKILVTEFMTIKISQHLHSMQKMSTVKHNRMFGKIKHSKEYKHLKRNWLQKTIKYNTNE